MSLYNMVHGINPNTTQLLEILGLTQAVFGRFRDIRIEDNFIIVHTRCGGGNREDYEDMFDEVSDHTWYHHDEDCDFDSTYADIYFLIPDETLRTFIGLYDNGKNPDEAWNQVLHNDK